MPELPEVQTIAAGLAPVLVGKTIREIRVHWHRSVEGGSASALDCLIGKEILQVGRRGKYIILSLGGSPLCRVTIHLRMTGKLLFRLGEKDAPYVRVEFFFQDGSYLYFVDIRKFGRIKVWKPDEPMLPCLGPEPLDAKIVTELLLRLETPRAIKTVLLDQRVLAGIGNIYADEALHLSGIHPLTPARAIPHSKRCLLGRVIPELLGEAILHKGTTFSDYATPDNRQGEHRQFLHVYGREGGSCVKCGSVIERICINNRSSHYCPACQQI